MNPELRHFPPYGYLTFGCPCGLPLFNERVAFGKGRLFGTFSDSVHRWQRDAEGWTMFEGPEIIVQCQACGCAEDDHAFGDAYRNFADQLANDGESRRDGPNVCLICCVCPREPDEVAA